MITKDPRISDSAPRTSSAKPQFHAASQLMNISQTNRHRTRCGTIQLASKHCVSNQKMLQLLRTRQNRIFRNNFSGDKQAANSNSRRSPPARAEFRANLDYTRTGKKSTTPVRSLDSWCLSHVHRVKYLFVRNRLILPPSFRRCEAFSASVPVRTEKQWS